MTENQKYTMKIIIDAMSGDNAPHEIIKDACLAKKEFSCSIILVGDETVIRESAKAQNLSLDGIEIVHASDVITMDDAPLAIREKRDSSMRVGFRLLHDGVGDAFVGAGNTGAMHVGSTLCVRRIHGIRRSAIAAFDGRFSEEVIDGWLKIFLRRFRTQQFKRSALPDGPKVGSIALSPRGAWMMPSDAGEI